MTTDGSKDILIKQLRQRIAKLEVSKATYLTSLEALQQSEEQYRSLFEHSFDMVYIHDLNGRFLDANNIALKVLGYSKDEITSLIFQDLLTDDQKPLAENILKELIETGTQKDLSEFMITKKDNEIIFVETLASVIYQKRKPFAVQVIGREITERKKLDDELHRHRERLEYLVQERTSELKEINKKLIHEIIVRKQVENELRISEKNLRSHNDIMMKELESARLIQKALMPREKPVYPSLKIDYRYFPLEAVGGDYFSFTNLQEGGFGVFIGDVTGHGVPAALFLSLIRSVTNQACRKFGMDPSQYIEMINNEVFKGMPSYFLTALYGVLKNQPDNVTFTFSRGGHPYPILYRCGTDMAEFVKTKESLLLGWLENKNFSETTVELHQGDRLFLYTDGITETINTERELLDCQENFLDLFQNPDGLSLEEKLDSIISEVSRFRGKAPIVDDIVIIGIEIVR